MFIRQRVPQKVGARGSLKWIQRLIELKPALLTNGVREGVGEKPEWTVEWVSPRRNDEWAEYRDAGFLIQLDLPELVPALKSFWPPGGPQWDALGKGRGGTVILVEAKAHFDELTSDCGAGERSRALIEASLTRTKQSLGAPTTADWTRHYYQYANRLAHLAFLRKQGVNTLLVFVYFYGDNDMGGPASVSEWKNRLSAVRTYLGYDGDLQSRGVINVFVSVESLSPG